MYYYFFFFPNWVSTILYRFYVSLFPLNILYTFPMYLMVFTNFSLNFRNLGKMV